MPPTVQARPHCCNTSLVDRRSSSFKPEVSWGGTCSSSWRSLNSSPLISGIRFSGGRCDDSGAERWRGLSRRGQNHVVFCDASSEPSSRFSGFEEEERSWEPVDSLGDSVDLVERNITPKQEMQTFLSFLCGRRIFDSQHLSFDSKWQADTMKVAVLAGIFGLQTCLPALAESLGLEVARSAQSTGFITDLSDFQSGFTSAFLLIFFSEIGDKTFFIAALLATRKSNLAVFTGTFGALASMTFISVVLGRAFHYLDDILPFSIGNMDLPLDDLAAVVLLVYFGVSTLFEAASMDGSKAEEEQQEAELAIAGAGGNGAGAASTIAATFALVFVAEWGDKSFFSTIALAAASSPAGVVTGAIAGHGLATVLAVVGGSFLGTYISEKAIAYVGGVLFLVFAAATLVEIVK